MVAARIASSNASSQVSALQSGHINVQAFQALALHPGTSVRFLRPRVVEGLNHYVLMGTVALNAYPAARTITQAVHHKLTQSFHTQQAVPLKG